MYTTAPQQKGYVSKRLHQGMVKTAWIAIALCASLPLRAQDEISRQLEAIDVQSLPGPRESLSIFLGRSLVSTLAARTST
jgi:hypothetical protein